MGYQESFISFRSEEILKKELKKHLESDFSKRYTRVTGAVQVIKEVPFFKKGELLLIVTGDRGNQYNKQVLREDCGIKNVKDIVGIDCCLYVDISDGDLGKFLDEHFKPLKENELMALLGEECSK
jgi:hypothetical protein